MSDEIDVLCEALIALLRERGISGHRYGDLVVRIEPPRSPSDPLPGEAQDLGFG